MLTKILAGDNDEGLTGLIFQANTTFISVESPILVITMIYSANRFHVAVRLFSNRDHR